MNLTSIDLKQQRIVVLMGGCSSEREISLKSGRAVFKALKQAGFDAIELDLMGETTSWYQQIQVANPDIAFLALHGTFGEDGCIQGMLEMMQIPYTGSNVLASALCMHKKVTKSILDHAGLKTPEPAELENGVPTHFPVFVKPIAEGSSVGLYDVQDKEHWASLVHLNLANQDYWMVESSVAGIEIAVSVLNGVALPPVEIVPKCGRYDFEAKYTVGATDYYCPARLPDTVVQQCMQISQQAVSLLGCSGAPRVDLIVPDQGEPVVLEVNTIPGMTETSLLPKSAAQTGMNFTQLCVAILTSASLEPRS